MGYTKNLGIKDYCKKGTYARENMAKCPTKASEIPYPSVVKEISLSSGGKTCYCPSGLKYTGRYYTGAGSNCLPKAYDSSYCDKIAKTPVSQSCPKSKIDTTCPTFTGPPPPPKLNMSPFDQKVAKRFKEVSQTDNPFKSLSCSEPVDRQVMAIFASIQEHYVSSIPKKNLQEYGELTEFAPVKYGKIRRKLTNGESLVCYNCIHDELEEIQEKLLGISEVKSLIKLWDKMTSAVDLLEFSFESAKLVEAARLGKDSKIIQSLTETLITEDIPNLLQVSGKMKVGKKILEYWGYKLTEKGVGIRLFQMVEALDLCLRKYG